MSCIGCDWDGKCIRDRCRRCCTCDRELIVVAPSPMTERPPVEHYLRCSARVGDFVIEPGLELREGDDCDKLWLKLDGIARQIGIMRIRWRDQRRGLEELTPRFEEYFPGRAWFVEIHDAELERWTQSYQPYGVPRNR